MHSTSDLPPWSPPHGLTPRPIVSGRCPPRQLVCRVAQDEQVEDVDDGPGIGGGGSTQPGQAGLVGSVTDEREGCVRLAPYGGCHRGSGAGGDLAGVTGRRHPCRCRFSSSVSNSGSLSGDMCTPQRSWSCTTSMKRLQITADLYAVDGQRPAARVLQNRAICCPGQAREIEG